MEEFFALIISSVTTTGIIGIIIFLSKNWFLERLKLSLQKEHSRFLDELQWDRKVKEQAAGVAEYLARARILKESSPEEDYIKANQQSWELAMWLPEEIYIEMTQAIVNQQKEVNPLSVVIKVRELLLKDKAGSLSQDNIAHHGPGIGKKQSQ